MGHSIYERERHLKRKTLKRYRTERTYRSTYGYGTAMQENWPRLKTLANDRRDWKTEEEAHRAAQAHGGQYQVSHHYTWGETISFSRSRDKAFYVRYTVRVGAPFREAVQTWETQEIDRASDLLEKRKEVTAGENYWRGRRLKWYRQSYTRKWRRQGNEIGRLAATGDDRYMDLDPQPERLGIAWMID